MPQLARLISAPGAPYGWIEFSNPRHGPDRWRAGNPGCDFACTFTLSLNDETSGVELDQIDPYASEMLGFFEEMARDADGWRGQKAWRSEYSVVEIAATHSGPGVELAVLMRWPPLYEQERRGVLTVSPDDLDRFAGQIRGLMRREHGHRFRTRRGES
jgi:hypothetical protein